MNTQNTTTQELKDLINEEFFLTSDEYRVEEYDYNKFLHFIPTDKNEWVKKHGSHMAQTIQQWLNRNYDMTIEQWKNRYNFN